ncbi:MAG: hypothetical protein ABSG03_38035 [Bryobacteraceae bacterium]|jgi:hypothetical protein
MAQEYLAMYLEITADFGKPSHFIPIMHFAETPARLAQDIRDEAFYTNEVKAGMALERIRNQTPFCISVLFLSTLPAMRTILSGAAKKQLHLMVEDLKPILNPPRTAPTIQNPEIETVQIWLGMKKKTTPYPEDFVTESNFTSGRFLVQFSDVQVRESVMVIKKQFFVVLTFFRVTGQIFMMPMDP